MMNTELDPPRVADITYAELLLARAILFSACHSSLDENLDMPERRCPYIRLKPVGRQV